MATCDLCGAYVSTSLAHMLHRAAHFEGKGQYLQKSQPEPAAANHSYMDATSFEEVWDGVSSRVSARVGRIKKQIKKQGGFLDLSKSAGDFDDTTTRAERYLRGLLSQKNLVKGSELHEVTIRGLDRVTYIRQLERMNARTPAKNLVVDLRKAERGLVCDLLEIAALQKGSSLGAAIEKSLERKAGG